jgi:MgtE intracellular N domain
MPGNRIEREVSIQFFPNLHYYITLIEIQILFIIINNILTIKYLFYQSLIYSMEESRLHVKVRVISIISVILVAIWSNNFYNSSQGYPLQTSTNTSKQIIHPESVTNSTNKKNMIDTRALAFNQSKQNEGKMSTGELGPPSNGIPANVKRYVDQLSNSSSSEIAGFPINDLSSETTMSVLKGLSVHNLYKVLKSIPVDDLSILLKRLTPDQVKEVLDKLPPNQKMDIQSRSRT